ncbi:MAG TPA: hypothetical protein VE984_03620 [Gaiellaceae bacterium]|nr:hypothetical protein [Gaiellaceae bacterium]
MSQGQGGPWKGRSEGPGANLQDAIVDAWDKAKGDEAPAGKYVVESIEIETSNPIHAYVVVIKTG